MACRTVFHVLSFRLFLTFIPRLSFRYPISFIAVPILLFISTEFLISIIFYFHGLSLVCFIRQFLIHYCDSILYLKTLIKLVLKPFSYHSINFCIGVPLLGCYFFTVAACQMLVTYNCSASLWFGSFAGSFALPGPQPSLWELEKWLLRFVLPTVFR